MGGGRLVVTQWILQTSFCAYHKQESARERQLAVLLAAGFWHIWANGGSGCDGESADSTADSACID
jgi:hypothetical protein